MAVRQNLLGNFVPDCALTPLKSPRAALDLLQCAGHPHRRNFSIRILVQHPRIRTHQDQRCLHRKFDNGRSESSESSVSGSILIYRLYGGINIQLCPLFCDILRHLDEVRYVRHKNVKANRFPLGSGVASAHPPPLYQDWMCRAIAQPLLNPVTATANR